jgi:peptidoglycan hydrolase-like protein with peptidoglycan-binding domain
VTRLTRRISVVGPAVAFALLLPNVLAVVAYQTLNKPPLEIAPDVEPVTVQLQTSQRQTRVDGVVDLDRAAFFDVLSPPEQGGLVTGVHISPGSPVGSGDRVYDIDGRSVVMYVSQVPFFRSLASGAVGPDVETLQLMLAEFGFRTSEPTGRFDRQTANEVRAFNVDSGGASDPVFSISSVLWLRTPGLIVTQGELTVGGPPPGPGSPVLLVWDSDAGGTLRDLAGEVLIVDEPLVLSSRGVDYGEVTSPQLGPEVVSELLVSAITSGSLAITDGEVEPIDVGLTSPTPESVQQLPIGSVVSNNGGRSCIYVVGSDGSLRADEVEIIGGEFGYVEVDPAPSLQDRVVANPLDVVDGPLCEPAGS